jgi:hypothetical protein
VSQPVHIDAVDGGLADHGDCESDYGQIDEELAAQITEDLEHEWAVALNKEEGDSIEEEEQMEDHERMVIEE